MTVRRPLQIPFGYLQIFCQLIESHCDGVIAEAQKEVGESVTLAPRRSVFIIGRSATSLLAPGMLVIAGVASPLISSIVFSGLTLWSDTCNPFGGTG